MNINCFQGSEESRSASSDDSVDVRVKQIRNKREFRRKFVSLLISKEPFRPWNDYKNQSQERRREANARERTRVHTISAAFDTLRRAVPAYSTNQKLSKLSVLRIACSYIVTLSKIINGGACVGDCIDLVSMTIQTEGRLRKRKDK